MPETKKETTTVKVPSKVTKAVKSTPAKPAAPQTNNEDMMKKHQQMVHFVQNLLSQMEGDIKRAHMILNQLAKFDPANPESLETIQKELEENKVMGELKTYNEENAEVVEGTFDGYFMI